MIALFGNAVLQVLLISLLVGAGVPALFSAGIRALAWGVGGDAEVSHERPHPVGRIVAYVLFALVVAIVLLGVGIVVSSGLGMKLSFEGGLPTFVSKH